MNIRNGLAAMTTGFLLMCVSGGVSAQTPQTMAVNPMEARKAMLAARAARLSQKATPASETSVKPDGTGGGPGPVSYTFSVLHSFVWSTDGGYPEGGGLAIDCEGNLYGGTSQGGAGKAGTLFKLSPSGKLTVLHAFTGGVNGGMDNAFNPTPVLDDAGNLYGTTDNGGATGNGVVFKVDPRGHETVLYSFPGGTGGSEAGVAPTLLRDVAGNLYGTTLLGGDLSTPYGYGGGAGCGLVYKIAAGKESVLYAFQAEAGEEPQLCLPDLFGPLIQDGEGNLYGTTTNGGTIYKLDPTGKLTVLYTFTGGTDNNGGLPEFGLVRDDEGNLYGTTTEDLGPGDVYKLDPSGNLTVLYTFTDGADGGYPNGPLVRDAAGNLYGTADVGGPGGINGCGVVFKVDPFGNETVLHTFSGPDGCGPYAGLLVDKEGNFYGTTTFGGTLSGGAFTSGVVFKLTRSPQLPW